MTVLDTLAAMFAKEREGGKFGRCVKQQIPHPPGKTAGFGMTRLAGERKG
jgi:hypothetical protein